MATRDVLPHGDGCQRITSSVRRARTNDIRTQEGKRYTSLHLRLRHAMAEEDQHNVTVMTSSHLRLRRQAMAAKRSPAQCDVLKAIPATTCKLRNDHRYITRLRSTIWTTLCFRVLFYSESFRNLQVVTGIAFFLHYELAPYQGTICGSKALVRM